MENKEVDKKKSKLGIVILIIFLIILLSGGGYFIYKQIYIEDSSNNENNNNSNNNTNNDNKIEDKKYELKIYADSSLHNICYSVFDSCTLVATIQTETEDAELIKYSYNYNVNNLFLYEDNGLKLYDNNTKKISKVNISNEYNDYRIINDNHISGIKDNYFYILNIDSGKEVIKEKYISYAEVNIDNEDGFNEIDYFNNMYILTLNAPENSIVNYKIYSSKYKEIIDFKDKGKSSIYQDYIYVNDDNTIKKYDLLGNLIKTFDYEYKVLDVLLDRVILLKDNKKDYIIKDINSNETLATFTATNNMNYVGSIYKGSKDFYHINFGSSLCVGLGASNEKKGIFIWLDGYTLPPEKYELKRDEKGNHAYAYVLDDKTNELFVEGISKTGNQCY